MDDEITGLLRRYENGVDLLLPLLEGLTEEQVRFKPSDREWSIREIMAHLADSEPNGALRMRMAIAECGNVVRYDQDAWAAALLYDDPQINNFDAIITLLRITLNRTTLLLKKIPAEFWSNRYVDHSEYGRMTLAELLRTYAVHIEAHAGQIERVLRQYSSAGSV